MLHALHGARLLREARWSLTGGGSGQIPSSLSPLFHSLSNTILSSVCKQGLLTLTDFSS